MVHAHTELTEEEYEALEAYARKAGVSTAEALRLGVARLLGQTAPATDEAKRRARAALGKYRESVDDVSERHDDYLAGTAG